MHADLAEVIDEEMCAGADDEVIHRLEGLAIELKSAIGSEQPIQSERWAELNDVAKTIETIVTALLTQKREKLVKNFAENFGKI